MIVTHVLPLDLEVQLDLRTRPCRVDFSTLVHAGVEILIFSRRCRALFLWITHSILVVAWQRFPAKHVHISSQSVRICPVGVSDTHQRATMRASWTIDLAVSRIKLKFTSASHKRLLYGLYAYFAVHIELRQNRSMWILRMNEHATYVYWNRMELTMTLASW